MSPSPLTLPAVRDANARASIERATTRPASRTRDTFTCCRGVPLKGAKKARRMIDRRKLAPWEGDDTRAYTLLEAASLCASQLPGLSSPPLSRITDADRELVAERNGWLRRLTSAGQSGEMKVTTGYHNVQKSRSVRRGEWGFEGVEHYTAKEPHWPAYTVERGELCRWLQSVGSRPEFFFPDAASSLAETDTADLPDYLADRISALRFAWRKHWANAKRDDGETWPRQSAVVETLKQRGFGSQRLCEAAATMIRPPWPTGRPPTGDQ